MNILDYVENLDIANGMTARKDCPVCGGLKTFTATNKNGMLIWNCYKAGCSVQGGTRRYLSVDDIRNSMQHTENEDTLWTKPEYLVHGCKHVDVVKFLKHWSLSGMEPRTLYDVKDHRIVFPVLKNKVMIDGVGRSLSNRLPKWKRYGESGLPYIYGDSRVAVVVEDAVSAAVVGIQGKATGVALLGTSLQDTHKEPLLKFSKIIVALDPDAAPKTLRIAQELRCVHSQVSVLKLKDDLKYTNQQDMTHLENLIWN